MATTTPSKATAPATDDELDRSEVSRTISMIRHELSGLVTDSQRKRPFYSRSQDEAKARARAAFKALQEFAAHIDSMKRS